jgi:hypothetical protein
MEINGSVAAILNERELMINRGSDVGVTEGMKFKVMEHERSIMDPETKTLLTTLQREKIRVKVIEVSPTYSIASTYQTYRVMDPTSAGLLQASYVLGNVLSAMNEVTKVRTFRQDATVSFTPIQESESIVKVGDPVTLVNDDI